MRYRSIKSIFQKYFDFIRTDVNGQIPKLNTFVVYPLNSFRYTV